jgi:hypothetical protein
MSPRTPSIVRIVGAVLLQSFVACTLTSTPYEPDEAVRPLAPPTAGAPSDIGMSGPSQPDEVCNPEASLVGCEIGLTPPGSACEDDIDCESRRCEEGLCQPATCADGVANQGESAVDCGGPCTTRCAAGEACTESEDCTEGFFCPQETRRCTANSCRDSVLNGDEASTDCGGACPGCPPGTPCSVALDCESGICGGDDVCTAASCTDDVQNQRETAPDCGGACSGCATGQPCASAADCQSGVCAGGDSCLGAERCCQGPSCSDGVRNGDEPVVDCGNAACGPCAIDHTCTLAAQCASGFCTDGFCRAGPCADGVRNGSETDIDCGGFDPACQRCAADDTCARNEDCTSGSCIGGSCSSCGDGSRNGDESDVDCGGSCGPCQPGLVCNADADCQSGACQDGRCCGGVVVDCTRCARRLSGSLSCNANGPGAAPNCEAFLDCLADTPDVCPVRYSPGCSDDPGGVCNHTRFGGNTGPGVALADAILGTASCFF